MSTHNIHDAKSNFSRLVDDAVAGHDVIIARAGIPVARLVPLDAAPVRRFGLLAGRVQFTPDVGAPLADDALTGLAAPAASHDPTGAA